jgi:hypothetical protein
MNSGIVTLCRWNSRGCVSKDEIVGPCGLSVLPADLLRLRFQCDLVALVSCICRSKLPLSVERRRIFDNDTCEARRSPDDDFTLVGWAKHGAILEDERDFGTVFKKTGDGRFGQREAFVQRRDFAMAGVFSRE